MKVTVCFDSVRVIVPCGNGELTVTELIQRAVSRYRKATNKPPDEFIQVHFLETSEDHGILDPDDMLCDVVDDKEKLLAVFQEGSSQTLHHPAQNGGYGTSASSVGTASPDLSQHEDETPKYIEDLPLKQYTSINNNKTENTNGEIKTVSRVTKSPPPPVPPKPVRHISVNSSRTSHTESIPSEDSGISSHDDRYRISSDSSKSEPTENVIVKPKIYRTGEATFVAIGTPVKQAMYNGQTNTERRRFSSTSSDHADNEHSNSDVEEETFSLGRNSTRKSMFVDSPMLDRWAELQEERMFVNNSHQEEPVSTVTSPSEPSSNEPDFAAQFNDDQRSESSESSGEPDMLMIQLKRENPLEPLGFTVAGYRTADSRELGLIVRNISSSGCAARDGRLEIADRIVEVNGWSLLDMPNERAEELFAAAIKAPVVNLGVSRSHSFVPGQKSDAEHEEEVIQARPAQENNQSETQEQSQREILPSTPQSLVTSPSIPDSSFKKVNKRILIELMKGNDGLGFSITTRDNPAGGNTPIFVKSILPTGAAIEGGQLKAGDQIVEVNGQKMAGKSQAEAVNTLRSTRGQVTLLVQREEVVQPSRTHAIEVNEDSLRHFREEGLQVLTFKIPLDLSGAAGLGVSVKGKSRSTSEQGRDSPRDKGIFVKSIIPGGAAAKDNRLCPDDQLLRVNNKSLVGLTNQAAMETLRLAMQSTRPDQAFIDVTIAREQDEPTPPPGELLQSRSLEELNAPDQERPIEAVSVEEPQRGTSETDGGVPNKERHPSGEEDQFNESITNKSLTPIRARNAVHRNDSYCVAVNKSQSPGTQFYSPFRQRPVHRLSPLAVGNNRAQPLAPSSLAMASSSEASTSATENVPAGRPTSTVAIPTPPVGTTDERPPGPGSPSQAPAKLPPPLPPPRWDSAADNYRLPAGLHLKLKMPDSQKTQEQRSQERGSSSSLPSTPPPPAQFSNQSPTTEFPPSYDQAVARLGRSPHASVSSEPTTPSKTWTEDSTENQIIAPPSPFSSEDGNPFQRDGFGRLSMSEKRGRAALDARQSEYFIKRDQERNETDNSEEGEVEQEETNPTIQQHPLRRADSEEQLRQQFEDDSREEIRTSPYGRMQKSRSTGQLKLVGIKNIKDKKSKSNDNLSFTSAVENANRSYPGDVQNGHARFSPSEEEVPITMKSNADFSAVQQKLAAKKPFYKGISSVFKIGKARRGDYSLSDNDGSAFKHTYNREALIDFPSEQRYRQLVNHYGQEKPSERSNTLPTRSRKKQETREKVLEEKRPVQTMKVGRVTVTAPTRV